VVHICIGQDRDKGDEIIEDEIAINLNALQMVNMGSSYAPYNLVSAPTTKGGAGVSAQTK